MAATNSASFATSTKIDPHLVLPHFAEGVEGDLKHLAYRIVTLERADDQDMCEIGRSQPNMLVGAHEIDE